VETVGRRISSASPAHGRMIDDGSGVAASAGAAAARLRKEEDDLGALGWSGLKLSRELGRLQKIQGKWKMGCRRSLGRKANWAADSISNFISRI
jgi:hypothetical protein